MGKLKKMVIKSINFTKVIDCLYSQGIPVMDINLSYGNDEVDFQILEEDTEKVKRIIVICK